METIHNINNAFSPGTANECTVQWWFKKSCEGDESFEDKELSGRPLEDDKDQLRESLKLILLNYTGSCWRTQHRPFYSRSAFEANWKGAKLNKQLSECFISWLKIKKKSVFWNVAFSYSTKQQQIISCSDCDVGWNLYFVVALNVNVINQMCFLQKESFMKYLIYMKYLKGIFGGGYWTHQNDYFLSENIYPKILVYGNSLVHRSICLKMVNFMTLR